MLAPEHRGSLRCVLLCLCPTLSAGETIFEGRMSSAISSAAHYAL